MSDEGNDERLRHLEGWVRFQKGIMIGVVPAIALVITWMGWQHWQGIPGEVEKAFKKTATATYEKTAEEAVKRAQSAAKKAEKDSERIGELLKAKEEVMAKKIVLVDDEGRERLVASTDSAVTTLSIVGRDDNHRVTLKAGNDGSEGLSHSSEIMIHYKMEDNYEQVARIQVPGNGNKVSLILGEDEAIFEKDTYARRIREARKAAAKNR